MNRSLYCLCLLCIVFFISCSSFHKIGKKKEIIKYTVFDSLENYLLRDIQKHAPERPIGVCIDPICKDCASQFAGQNHGQNLFSIALVYKSECYPSAYDMEIDILSKSNRYLVIDGKLYPIYFIWIDDTFFDYLHKNTRSIDEWVYPPVGNHHFLFVDMALHKFH